jgi:carboxylesterase
MNRVGSTDKELVLLNNSYHVATLDHDAELIFERTHEFAEARAPAAHRADDIETDQDAEASSQDR